MAQATKQTPEKNQETTQQGLARREDRSGALARRDDVPFFGPFSMLNNFRREMDRLFEDFGFGGRMQPFGFGNSGAAGTFDWSPQTEIFERGNELVVRADLPGLKKDDIDVDLEEDRITIRGERKSEHEENREGIYRSERSYGSFYRTIPLPQGVDGDKAKADFHDGVLEITMPKPETKPRGRKIEIGGGATQ
jgi:HSP20 family protein